MLFNSLYTNPNPRKIVLQITSPAFSENDNMLLQTTLLDSGSFYLPVGLKAALSHDLLLLF